MMNSNNTFSSSSVDIFRQNGDICAYLNISFHTKFDKDNLTAKFSALDAAGLNVSTSFLWEYLFPTIAHQTVVAKCAYDDYIEQVKSDVYLNGLPTKKGYLSTIWPWIVLPSSFSLLAILFNLSLIIVTIRKISLSKLCNWLLAFDSMCQIPALLPFLVNFVAVCLQLNTVGFPVCLAALLLSTGSSYASFLAVFIMSLERLLIVLFPMQMNLVGDFTIKVCSLLAFFVCTVFGIAMTMVTFNVWTIINLPYDSSLYCNSGLYSDVLNTNVSYVVLLLTLLNYVLISLCIVWRRYRLTRSNSSNVGPTVQNQANNAVSAQVTRRMLRSVFVISFVLLIGWVIGSAARNVITNATTDAIKGTVYSLIGDQETADRLNYNLRSWVIGAITCLFILAAGINAPILIANNHEYRKAYKRTYLNILMGKKSSVGPLFTTIRSQQVPGQQQQPGTLE